MTFERSQYTDKVCRTIGIKKRRKPGSAFFTKHELIHLLSWLEVASNQLEAKEQDEHRLNTKSESVG